MSFTISSASLLRTTLDESGTRLFVETKRDLPNFTFELDDEHQTRAFLVALGSIERPASAVASTVAPIPALLQRGDLTSIEWVEALRAQSHYDYRSAPVGAVDLWRVLEDIDAPHDARAAPAIALAPSLDKAGRNRMRRLKDDAPYRLRVALKAARGTDTAATLRALDACSADELS